VTGLKGLRVFVVEDEFLISLSLQEDLADAGCIVVGPHSTLSMAIEASRTEAFDIAVLDVNLNGEPSYPLVDELRMRGIPFVLLTGYGAADLPERLGSAPRLPKPYDPAILLAVIERAAPRPPPT
jgi:DNA-binding response OmpR family regulator